MKEIPVYDKEEIIATTRVSDERYDFLNQHKWYLSSKGYVYRWKWINGGNRNFLMHREILGLEYGDERQGDHIDRDRLNNLDENLRIVSHAEQAQNQSLAKNNISGYRGVSWDSRRRKWLARVGTKYLGGFTDREEAAKVVLEYRKKHMPYSTD